MAKQGKCSNFGNCTTADNKKVIREMAGQDFVCPECGGLLSKAVKKSAWKWLIACIFIIPILVFAGKSFLLDAEQNTDKPTLANTFDTAATYFSANPPAADKPALDTCKFDPIKTPTKPNWYAVIEVGSKSIKPIAVKLQPIEQKNLKPDGYEALVTQDVNPSDAVSIPKVTQAICADINYFHNKYGDLPIHIVGSSSMATVSHRVKLVDAITSTIKLPIEFVTAFQEASFFARGIWVPPFKPKRRCESAVIDIGSGNIKGGYLENCNASVQKASAEHFVSFDIQVFGTVEFSKKAQQDVDNKTFPTFVESAKSARELLELRLNEQVQLHPELANSSKRFYLAGGAIWAMNSLLCLDCPQYKGRAETDDEKEYTVIRPEDIEEFYQYVTKPDVKVCDSSQENPYLRRDMDGTYHKWDEKRIAIQKTAITKVCSKFKDIKDLISAAEILRAVKNKMGFNEKTHIFFMQSNLYIWSRQYLIDKLQPKSSDAI